MPYSEEMVSADPGVERVPTSGSTHRSGPDDGDASRKPVMAGLEAEADTPEAAEPLLDPQELVGERPAKGSDDNPG
jgi:hypothetical protein